MAMHSVLMNITLAFSVQSNLETLVLQNNGKDQKKPKSGFSFSKNSQRM